MFDFGDDLTIATLSIPWIVWIQIFILFLLLLLLFFFGLFSPDLADSGGCSSSSVSRPEKSAPVSNSIGGSVIANPLQNSQAKGGVARGTSRSRRVFVGVGEVEDTEGYESMEAAAAHMPLHPCHYFRLAKLAFLKCLGLDSLHRH